MQKQRFSLTSAYAQLVIMVFVPIAVLASVGATLVFRETETAIRSEQQALATAALIRYEPTIESLLPKLVTSQRLAHTQSQNQRQDLSQNAHERLLAIRHDFATTLATMNNDQHVRGVAVLDAEGNVLVSDIDIDANNSVNTVMDETTGTTLNFPDAISWRGSEQADWDNIIPTRDFVAGVATKDGTAYGHRFAEVGGEPYWLFVDMDDEPLTIARLKVWMAVIFTGLFTMLMLLLGISSYSRRWVSPVYDLRLHLQKLTADNLYQPIQADTRGELNQLQQDLAMAFRRLHAQFQDLRTHAKQTEDDLQIAFDDMEMQTILIREARDKAVSTSQAKSAFLANISHELRTPLNSIDGFINLLARHGKLSPEQDSYVQTIRKSSAHLLALVNDVLDFSKMEAGKLTLDRHELDLYATVYEVLDMLSPLAYDKGLRMAVMYYDDVPHCIIGDGLRIKQVLTNLVGNAIKFTDAGDVVVRVSLDEVAENDTSRNRPHQDMITIAVQDSGQGISKEMQAKLFKSFSQGDPTVTRQYGGTGLGLVISKQLTRMMGGQIGFYNNEASNPTANSSNVTSHKGATFWFSLPALQPASGQDCTAHDVVTSDDVIHDLDKLDASNRPQQTVPSPWQLPVLSEFGEQTGGGETYRVMVWLGHVPSLNVLMASMQPLLDAGVQVTQASSLAGTLDTLKETKQPFDWVVIDADFAKTHADQLALLKQIRLHHQGKLAMFGYQVALDASLLNRYHASGLYQPLDRRQIYQLMDTQKRPIASSQIPQWQGKTVLAVDDHPPNLLVLEALLGELGIHVLTASSGMEAIAKISPQLMHTGVESNTIAPHIDLIFMDIQMPKMSGHDTAQHIRKLEDEHGRSSDTPHLPIIALSAHGLADEKETLLQSGMDDYVGKPISRPQLLQILQRWLGDGESVLPHTELAKTITDASDASNLSSNLAKTVNDGNTNHESPTQDENAILDNLDDNPHFIIDWQDALNRSANKPELAKQLLSMMQNTVPDELQDLNDAWADADRERLAQISHRILGASRYTGVPQVRETSQRFEDKCLLNPTHTTPAQMAMLKPHFHALIEALENLQAVDLQKVIVQQIDEQASEPTSNNAVKATKKSKHETDDTPSENDMTWKMI